MKFRKFADLMVKVGFQEDEPIAPVFTLTKQDLQQSVFRTGLTKVAGNYHVVSIWSQGGSVAFWAKEEKSGNSLFSFHKEEVDFLAKKNKFKKT
ncbi:MAG: hypothetical protein A3I24_02135 [Candidatus Harrisonbacteria bacterium RIFCSPLOWO2_02_FULL_41_13b]|uniref:Uncharacterized protein n=1 Tax=Candidatus Harrisonbacteria bacterium RIFCSPLOWO2_02_FULL_41_13b TaxID=1798409 RepID=A0A1G1ZTP9_9BACT|nr:MAG: hypothetical protein A3J53_00995 [Candidatus Harrisonbacteria bacterium RIFCSPHIGHO2_02_FULL_40_20]OGY67944.1 MAG: hypothetical protein A3I24_02135 [Candidatus Harrisonbacteria bacterium RIFCSPLOWO2_02_FULL_41_13b]